MLGSRKCIFMMIKIHPLCHDLYLFHLPNFTLYKQRVSRVSTSILLLLYKIRVCIFIITHSYIMIISRVHNIYREGECLTAYTCFKHTASSTESTPPGVN